MMQDNSRSRSMTWSVRRRGAAAVEFAVVLPVIVLLFLGSIEMGRSVMVRHVLEETARAGCRVAAFENSTTQDVIEIIDASMAGAGIENYTTTITPDPPDNLAAFEPVTVSISVPFSDVSWLASSTFMNGKTLTGLCVMPAEGDGANDPDSNTKPSTKKNRKSKKDKKSKGRKKRGHDDDDDDDGHRNHH